jgi:thioredoxin reductase
VSKERLLSFWNDVVSKTGLVLNFGERMQRVERDGDSFIVHTSAGAHRTRSLLLAIGRRGSPRTLGVPGEDLPKVVYRLVDAEQYRGLSVLVVGGGDSALEAALALAGEPDVRVLLSYRGAAFSRAKEANRQALDQAIAQGRIEQHLGSEVEEITPQEVRLRTTGGLLVTSNDAVIVCVGGDLPMPLLQQVGIEFKTKHGSA